jgi:hypothetical protein
VEHDPEHDPREAIFRLAVERGWVLTELRREAASLEDVFVRLTTRETVTPAPEEASGAGEASAVPEAEPGPEAETVSETEEV